MLSKCANPDCTTTLHYLREGKVFKVENDSDMFLVKGTEKKPVRKVEHYWLCGPCSESHTLISDREGVQVVPKPLLRRAAAS